ncbi:MAG: hypothetical protein MI867_05400, partial [Pseudomonadales bacterium]|nr:hypothetical protein [Pseudomonadales bacterium]
MGFKVKQKSIKRTTIGAASLLALACTPPTDIFTPVSGTSFNSSEATVVIEGLDMATAVCYTTDGSEPVWNNGTCSGGTTQRIQGPVVSANIEIACGDDTGENVARTVNVQHDWNGQVGFGASANYFLNCGESDGGGSDGGGSDGGGEQPQNLTLTSTADAYVDVSAPNQNFGSDAAMFVDLAPNELHSSLKFDVPELTASLESAT